MCFFPEQFSSFTCRLQDTSLTRALLGCVLLTVLALPSYAQPTVGAFGGPSLRLSTIDDDAVLFFGGRGGVSLRFGSHHTVTLGGGVHSLAFASPEVTVDNALRALDLRYAGVELGYVLRTERVFHAGVRTLLGRGATSFRFVDVQSSFSVAELTPHLTVNFTTNLRAEVAAGYRFVQGANLNGVTDEMLRAPFVEFTVLFGIFGPAPTLDD